MIGEMLCPDCGGVVGATETTEAGAPCRCFTAKSADLSDQPDEAIEPAVQAAPVEKICIICGQDVTGKKRVKDPRGYFCYACAKEDEKKQNQGRVRCGACGHLHKDELLIMHEGRRICANCYKERIDVKKLSLQKLGIRGARTREELRRVYILTAAVLVLGVIMAIGAYRLMHPKDLQDPQKQGSVAKKPQ